MSKRYEYGRTDLHYAVLQQNIEKIESLLTLDLGSICDNDGCTALHFAAMYDFSQTAQIILDNQKGIKLLNIPDNNGYTALHLSAWTGSIKVMKILLKYLIPEEVSILSHEGRSAADLAEHNGHTEACQIIMDYLTQTESMINLSGETNLW